MADHIFFDQKGQTVAGDQTNRVVQISGTHGQYAENASLADGVAELLPHLSTLHHALQSAAEQGLLSRAELHEAQAGIETVTALAKHEQPDKRAISSKLETILKLVSATGGATAAVVSAARAVVEFAARM